MTRPLPMVLLAEDSADDAYFFQRALKRTGLECSFTHVWDGGAAIQFIQRAAASGTSFPDLIFLDLKMPILGGFEVLHWLQTQSFLAPPCVIVLSGSNQDTDTARAAELGASDYLVKPISSQTMAGRIEKLLQAGEPQGRLGVIRARRAERPTFPGKADALVHLPPGSEGGAVP